MTAEIDTAQRNSDPYRYSDDDSRPFFLNWPHYRDAHHALQEVLKDASGRVGSHPNMVLASSIQRQPEGLPWLDGEIALKHASTLTVPEENRRLPVPGHFAFYSDLLGFTTEVSRAGMDSLPDFYGGALYAATKAPHVNVYVLSDSCAAFAHADSADEFVQFVATVFSRWLSNGLIPKCSVGHGSFVERRPFADDQPSNFFGTQIVGTALTDATRLIKESLGSRVLISASACEHWPRQGPVLRRIGQDIELFPERSRSSYLFDCVYYMLCLRVHAEDTRQFQHYVWTLASRGIGGGVGLIELAASVACAYCGDATFAGKLPAVVAMVGDVMKRYE